MTRPPCSQRPSANPPCRWEGLVCEHAPCGDMDKHVHLCISPDESAPDKCVRGPSAALDSVRSCATCKLREARLPTPH